MQSIISRFRNTCVLHNQSILLNSKLLFHECQSIVLAVFNWIEVNPEFTQIKLRLTCKLNKAVERISEFNNIELDKVYFWN